MKPSIQSHFFRLLSRALSAYMASKEGITEWRKLTANRREKPSVPSGVVLERAAIEGVPAEWLVPEGTGDTKKAILYIHGGAWLFGWYNPHRKMVGYLAREAGLRTLAVDYRLAPENPFPAALEDCLAAYHYLLDCGYCHDQVVLAGDSAGGNLVITTMLALRAAGEALPAAGVCISPATNLAHDGESNATNAKKDAILSSGLSARFRDVIRDGYIRDHDPHSPLISPVFADLHGLPALLVQAGEDEVLVSSITKFVEKARQDGVQVSYEIWPAMWHVWHLFTPHMPESKAAVSAVCRFVKEQLAWIESGR